MQTCLFQKPASQTLPRVAFEGTVGFLGSSCAGPGVDPYDFCGFLSAQVSLDFEGALPHPDHAASAGFIWLLALIRTSLGTKLQIYTLGISHFAKDGGTLRDLLRFVL